MAEILNYSLSPSLTLSLLRKKNLNQDLQKKKQHFPDLFSFLICTSPRTQMLKEKFKEVGRANNEIYSEDLSNIRGSILGVSGSYFTKKMFEGVYTYSDHSIGMSVRMLECKVAKFRKVMAKYNLSVVIVFENYLSVRWNQRNSILKRTLVQENVQFVNTPYSEHAQLLFYLKNNLLSGIVSELDVIKYFSETNNQVIVDFDLEGGDTFEWIHVSKFLASMNLTLHYAR